MAFETECILRPNLGTSADVPDVPSPTSMQKRSWKLRSKDDDDDNDNDNDNDDDRATEGRNDGATDRPSD